MRSIGHIYNSIDKKKEQVIEIYAVIIRKIGVLKMICNK